MGILANFQFNCDSPECKRMCQVSGNVSTVEKEVKQVLQRGWLRQGDKCYCPDCSEGELEDNKLKEIRG